MFTKRVCKIFLTVAMLFSMSLIPVYGTAHDGPVDRNGCHPDGQGRWHCH